MEHDIRQPPSTNDIQYNQVSKLWIRCPECTKVHELWPKEIMEIDGPPENELIDRVLECYLSHDWTPDDWEEADEMGLIPESWAWSPTDTD